MEELIDVHFNGQLNLYLSTKQEHEKYDIYYSDVIEDEYWNLAYLKNTDIDFSKVWEEIKHNMNKLKRKPIIYITSNIINEKINQEIKKLELKQIYTDVWMILNDLEQFEQYDSKIEFSIHRVDENLKTQFVKAVMEGFSGENLEDPYGALGKGYEILLYKSFENNSDKYKIQHYLGIYQDESVSTATVVYKKENAIIYNVTTKNKYQKQGICKNMMSYIIKDLSRKGIKTVCMQTEKGYYTQEVYGNMEFKKVMTGNAYIEN